MNITAALDTAVHYTHTNPGTIAIATGSTAVDGLPGTLVGRCF